MNGIVIIQRYMCDVNFDEKVRTCEFFEMAIGRDTCLFLCINGECCSLKAIENINKIQKER